MSAAPHNTESARIYFDVDGVFNAVARNVPDWGWGSHARAKVLGYPILYSPDFVALVNRIATTPGVGVYWLTTWCHEAPGKLAPALGIDGRDWPVVGYEHWRSATGLPWWKHRAIVEHLEGFDGPVLWIDDDHGVDPAAVAWLAGQPQVLAIAPHPGMGVTRAEADIIERFVSELVPFARREGDCGHPVTRTTDSDPLCEGLAPFHCGNPSCPAHRASTEGDQHV